jgi:ATP-dependent Clp protease adaptor protein ClpS
MHNDDLAPMEFVEQVLRRFFHMSKEQATRTMLDVRCSGMALCGVYPYEIAETKASEATLYARTRSHPLQMSLERE